LILGCGNAKFSEELYDAGYCNQWNVDISDVVIEQMQVRNKSRSKMVYEVMDVCNMTYPDNFFDVAIDKSTIDSILCGENPVLNCFMFLKEC
jgi:EEF1A lysine methyltransferase 4